MSSAPIAVTLDPIEEAVRELAAGRPVIVVDDADRENEGDLIFAASAATEELMAQTMRLGGLICVALPGATCDRLGLPPMTAVNEDAKGTAFTISIDAAQGVSTGISAADRAHTARLLAQPGSQASDFTRPGHLFPLRARSGGVLVRRGHTEAAVDLCRLAGLEEAGIICEIANPDGTMARLPQLRQMADERGWPLISIEDLVAYRQRSESLIERAVVTSLPTSWGRLQAMGYHTPLAPTAQARPEGAEQLALVFGDLDALRSADEVLVRVHSECLTGDVFGSGRCDCGPQLHASMEAMAAAGTGVLIYVRGHEGRGIGLLDKLRAYSRQDAGEDTVQANMSLGLPADARDYTVAAQILRDLGVRSIALLTNNPNKATALAALGVPVARTLPVQTEVTETNHSYLHTKANRMGHDLPWLVPTPTLTQTTGASS